MAPDIAVPLCIWGDSGCGWPGCTESLARRMGCEEERDRVSNVGGDGLCKWKKPREVGLALLALDREGGRAEFQGR